MEAEKSQNLQLASWRFRRAGGVVLLSLQAWETMA